MKKGKINLREVSLLGGSSFFNDVGSELITPILPFYISALGGGGIAVGLVSGLREGLASFFKFFGGWLSDRVGKRKPFVFFGYIMSIIFRFMLSIVNSWYFVIGFVSLERFGKLRDAPRDAMISASVKKDRGEAFGLHQAMDTMGGVVGTILVIFLYWKLNLDIKTIIIFAAGISLLSLVPLIFVKEAKTKPKNIGFLDSVHKISKQLKYFIFVSSIFTLANFGLYMFLILRAEELSGNVLFPLIIYAVFSFAYAVFSEPFGKLSDKIGRKKVLLIGYILFFVITIGFIFSQSLFYFSILFILYGLVYAMTQPNQRALVSDLSGDMKATAFGFFSSVIGIVNIFGGLIAGILWDISYSTMFTYLAVVSLVSIFFLFFVREKN
jgi:MFS family permease